LRPFAYPGEAGTRNPKQIQNSNHDTLAEKGIITLVGSLTVALVLFINGDRLLAPNEQAPHAAQTIQPHPPQLGKSSRPSVKALEDYYYPQ
jgi:hypothetical protein